jgi:DNA polymerase-3 subunit alpha (Gram-positive type)
MSTQDGISSAEDIIRRAEKYKVEAVGIADRSNVQSFPQIDYFAKHDIKPLYGIEINV